MQTANPDPPIHGHQFWPDTSCIRVIAVTRGRVGLPGQRGEGFALASAEHRGSSSMIERFSGGQIGDADTRG